MGETDLKTEESGMNLQYWIDLSVCHCASKRPIGGCLHCDLVEYEKQLTEVLETLKDAKREIELGSVEPLNYSELCKLITKLEKD